MEFKKISWIIDFFKTKFKIIWFNFTRPLNSLKRNDNHYEKSLEASWRPRTHFLISNALSRLGISKRLHWCWTWSLQLEKGFPQKAHFTLRHKVQLFKSILLIFKLVQDRRWKRLGLHLQERIQLGCSLQIYGLGFLLGKCRHFC